MNIIRKCLAVLSAFLLAMVAGGAAAQNVKYFQLGAPASAGVATTTIQLTFKNIENGNSSFNSLGMKGTGTGGVAVTITGATASSPFGPGAPLVTGDGYFYLTGLSPVKKGQTVTVTLTVQMTGSGCTNGSIAWQGRAFTGNPTQPSTEFQQTNANPVTTVATSCSYTISGTTPASISRGTTKTLKANVANAAASAATITSVTLTPPPGSAIASPTNNYAVSIAPNTNADISITATASCNPAKSAGAWTHSVTGFTPSGSVSTSLGAGACSVAFSPPPTSILDGVPFNLEVKVKDGDGNPIVGFGGNVTLQLVGNDCTLVGTHPAAAVDGVVAFNGIKLSLVTDTGTCTLKAKSAIDGADFESAPLTLKVFDGVLACNNVVPAFDALNLPATGPGSFTDPTAAAGVAGFVTGMRGAGNDKLDPNCTNINYSIYNNIQTPDSGSSLTDPAGNIVPPGYFSFTWDMSQALNPVVAILTTYRSEWGDAATGLPVRQTKVCTKAPLPCTVPSDYQVVPACVGTLIERASVPAGASACLAAESWRVVSAIDPQYCAETPPSAPPSPPVGWAPRCLQATSIVIFGTDPVFGR